MSSLQLDHGQVLSDLADHMNLPAEQVRFVRRVQREGRGTLMTIEIWCPSRTKMARLMQELEDGAAEEMACSLQSMYGRRVGVRLKSEKRESSLFCSQGPQIAMHGEKILQSSRDETNSISPSQTCPGQEGDERQQVEEDLPPGWRQYWSRSKGRPYYKNKATGETLWRKPLSSGEKKEKNLDVASKALQKSRLSEALSKLHSPRNWMGPPSDNEVEAQKGTEKKRTPDRSTDVVEGTGRVTSRSAQGPRVSRSHRDSRLSSPGSARRALSDDYPQSASLDALGQGAGDAGWSSSTAGLLANFPQGLAGMWSSLQNAKGQKQTP